MKIDLVIASLMSGGAERVVSTLANFYASEGHEVTIITFKEGDRYELHPKVKRVKLHKNLPVFNYVLVRTFLYLLKYYAKKSNRPDVLNSHVYLMGLATIPIAKFYNIKVAVSEHSNYKATPMNTTKKILWDHLYKYADLVTILTSYDWDFFSKRNNNVVIMPNPNSFTPVLEPEKNKEPSIIVAGGLDRYKIKGFDTALEVFSKVVASNPDWKLKIVGEGDKGKLILKELAETKGIRNQVEFLGYRSDIDRLMQQSAIFMLSSRYEGLPMALMEAASQGIACIAFNCISGPSEIIEDGKNGILVEDQNIDQMVVKLEELMLNEKLRQKLAKQAAKDSSRFSLKVIGGKWLQLFKGLK